VILVDHSIAWTLGQSFKDLVTRSHTSLVRLDAEPGTLKIATYEQMWSAAALWSIIQIAGMASTILRSSVTAASKLVASSSGRMSAARNRIKRVPIVEGSKLVSRANILQALASAAKKLPSLASPDDTELRKKVVSRMASEAWRPTMLTVTVQDGTVDLWGLVHSVEQKKAAQLAAETTPGVRAVVNNIIVQRLGSGWS
jgi:hypothetical protein